MRLRRRDEQGATALLVAIVATVLFGAAALAVDFSSLAMERQQLHDNIDAAAHAGAYELPGNGNAATAAALAMAKAQDSAIDPDVDLWCVVRSVAGQPDGNQIPGTCDPGSPPYTKAAYPGTLCNAKVCTIPCFPAQGDQCNAVRVSEEKAVPFGFARMIGFNTGNTGSVTTLACKGSCGEETANPLDIVVMADRTPSMSDDHRHQMVNGIRSMLATLDPTQHYVALGTLHKSAKSGEANYTTSCPANNTAGMPANGSYQTYAQKGTWIPVPFTKEYQASGGLMDKALTCIYSQPNAGVYGTQLASALKAASRHVLGLEGANPSALGPRSGEVKKVVIFETDGSPDETWKGGSTSVTSSGDVAFGFQAANGGSDQNGVDGCQGMVDAANAAKDKGVIVITIGFGRANTASCKKRAENEAQPSPYVRNYLAAAASPAPDGSPSTAGSCASGPQREAENTDGDYYFCADTGAELKDVFKLAIGQVTTGIRFLEMPTS